MLKIENLSVAVQGRQILHNAYTEKHKKIL